MCNKKFWGHYLTLKQLIYTYTTLFLSIPLFSIGFSLLSYPEGLEMATGNEIKMMVVDGLMWGVIITLFITIICIVWFLFHSDRVECTNSSIKYHRWIFSKTYCEIPYDEITRCIFSDGLWRYKGRYLRGFKIRFFDKNDIVLSIEMHYKLCVLLVQILGEKKVEIIDENLHTRNINKYFKINFLELEYEQQLKCFKHYSSTTSKYKTAEEILKRKG